jgi:hypothetical protein
LDNTYLLIRVSKQNLDLLDLANIRHLDAAIGWLGLGSVADARAELDCIPPDQQSHPAVLEARWLVCAYEKTWHDALVVADQEIAAAPEAVSGWLHRAYALRRVDGGSLALAWDALFPAAERFPSEPVVAYNLSCYACQMNDLDASRVWLQRAVKSGGKETIKKMALDDDDLKPLWPEIKHL